MKLLRYAHQTFYMVLILCASIYIINSCDLNRDWDEHYSESDLVIGDNVLKLIGENGNYSRFYDKLVETGYDSLLVKDQYFTIFVPVNSSFDGLPEYSASEWKQIIGFHISYFNLFSRDFGDVNLQSIIGKYLKIRESGDGGFRIFEGKINMDHVDANCQNGVIHEIDKVQIPRQNVYEYIMNLDENYSLIKTYLNSMDNIYPDLENSIRIGVDDNGNTIYDTVWTRENFFLDNIALLNTETENYTSFVAKDEDVLKAINNAKEYFGDINDMDEDAFFQLLSITFSANFYDGIYESGTLPDTMTSVVGKKISTKDLDLSGDVDLEMSNGLVHELNTVNIPKEFFLFPINIECEDKAGRRVSNTVYSIELKSDTRASNGSYLVYGSKFVGDYIEWTVDMVLATKYWLIWTGPKLGGSYYQLYVEGERVGDSVECYYKGNFKPVVSGTYDFESFGTKTVRMTIASEETLPGYNSMFLDYIRLIPDELYNNK